MIRAYIAFFIFAISFSTRAQPAQFDLQGHRGARGLYPENSIPAFIAAMDLGVTTLEMDVVITADHQVLVSHDPWINPDICSDSSGNKPENDKLSIYKLTYAQVAKFNCGIGNPDFPQQAVVPVTKPLLRDVIKAVERHLRDKTNFEVDYSIEIKSSPGGDNKLHPEPAVFSELVYSLINDYLPWNRIIIQSLDIRVLQYWHAKYPKVRLALLVENKFSPETNIKKLGFNPTIYSPEESSLTASIVSKLHQQGILVIPWTVNQVTRMTELALWKVDGLITDYPDRAAAVGLSRNSTAPAAVH